MPAARAAAVEALRAADEVAVLTGAGMSAESGIPTFRDAQTGLWASFRPEELATPEAFERDPVRVWSWYAERRRAIRAAEPNAAHHALVALEGHVDRVVVITQNIDGLHRKAGSSEVWELHGSILRSICARERTEVPVDRAEEAGEGSPPRCPECGAFLRPDVVWFGEILPQDALQAGFAAATTCDVFLSVGTSNLVYPAAGLPWMAAERGAPVLVVNTDMEGQERGPNVHWIRGRAGDVLPDLVAEAFGR